MSKKIDIQLKRAYVEASPDDGFRALVDRLWPRGVSKEKAKVEIWLKEIAPSTDLRKWFGHDPEKWKTFRERYTRELDANAEVLDPLLKQARHGRVTLVYSAKDEEHNDAVVLQEYLRAKLGC